MVRLYQQSKSLLKIVKVGLVTLKWYGMIRILPFQHSLSTNGSFSKVRPNSYFYNKVWLIDNRTKTPKKLVFSALQTKRGRVGGLSKCFYLILIIWIIFWKFPIYNNSIFKANRWKIQLQVSLFPKSKSTKRQSGKQCSWKGKSESKELLFCDFLRKNRVALLPKARLIKTQTIAQPKSTTSTSPSSNNDLYFPILFPINIPTSPMGQTFFDHSPTIF